MDRNNETYWTSEFNKNNEINLPDFLKRMIYYENIDWDVTIDLRDVIVSNSYYENDIASDNENEVEVENERNGVSFETNNIKHLERIDDENEFSHWMATIQREESGFEFFE